MGESVNLVWMCSDFVGGEIDESACNALNYLKIKSYLIQKEIVKKNRIFILYLIV